MDAEAQKRKRTCLGLGPVRSLLFLRNYKTVFGIDFYVLTNCRFLMACVLGK